MAVKGVTIAPVDGAGGTVLVTWAAMNGGDVGEWVQLAHLPDKTIQAAGAASLLFEGTNDPAGGAVSTLQDVDNTSFINQTLLNAKMAVVKPGLLSIRPNLTSGTNIVCRMLCR